MTYTPYLDEGLERWLLSTARRSLWRVPSWYTVKDLEQDGYACFYKCVARYQRLGRKRKPHKEDRRNFMALVRTTFERHIHDLSTKHTRQKIEKPVSQYHRPEVKSEDWLERHGQVIEDSITDLTLLIYNAPWEIRQAIAISISGAAQDYKRVRPKHKPKASYTVRETTNEYLCRQLSELNPQRRFDPKKVDIVDMVRQYFGVYSTA